MFDRAQRRAAKERMKAKARRIYPDWPDAEHNADNLAKCSCPLCGNPRHFFKGGQTMQEKRAELKERD